MGNRIDADNFESRPRRALGMHDWSKVSVERFSAARQIG